MHIDYHVIQYQLRNCSLNHTTTMVRNHFQLLQKDKNRQKYKVVITPPYTLIETYAKYFKNKKISLSNTGGILLGKKFILDQTRPGIGIYGYDANGKNIILNKKKLNFPAKLKVPILQIRYGKKGDKVSYGRTETLNRDSKLATIGIGYADGILRMLKKNISLMINGKSCRIIGSITMDSLIIDITDVEGKNLKVGSYLELINEELLIQWNKSDLGISIYELFTLISNRVIRKYV